jgi:hypothetical protein
MSKMNFLLSACVGASLFLWGQVQAQGRYWQQSVDYKLSVALDVQTNKYTGSETLTYHNNSPDTLKKAYFHLYYNAFQPESDMDYRSRTIADADPRVGARIKSLKPEEIGEIRVMALMQDGQAVQNVTSGTILEVTLAKPVPPGGQTVFTMNFAGQVPLQIRRAGRDNAEGIRYSMSQWYPKLCEYDAYGWHANPYIGREFHGVWGDFDVNIELDGRYMVAATGVLQNPEQVGHGYAVDSETAATPAKLRWHYKATRVHDFVWAADPGYTHLQRRTASGINLHFFYREDSITKPVWSQLPAYTEKAFDIMARDYGAYAYPSYSVIQGGDGGMEYPMATLITGRRSLGSLVGVTVHEMIHSWFQGMLATNESLYPWMDEGFTSYASSEVMAELFPPIEKTDPHSRAYDGYFALYESGFQEPLTTHADHYQTNYCYGVSSYNKGEVFLAQLEYIIGPKALRQGMKNYFNAWKFKHPTSVDFMRVMELTTGLELDWYFEYFINTIHGVDYGIRSVKPDGKRSAIVTLSRTEPMPMPLEVLVTLEKGETHLHYIPLDLMRGEKQLPAGAEVHADWPWVRKEYTLNLPYDVKDIVSIEIDPAHRMTDISRENNVMDAKTIKEKPWEQYEK